MQDYARCSRVGIVWTSSREIVATLPSITCQASSDGARRSAPRTRPFRSLITLGPRLTPTLTRQSTCSLRTAGTDCSSFLVHHALRRRQDEMASSLRCLYILPAIPADKWPERGASKG